MYTPMTNKAPQLIGTFNDIDVYDCRITVSMEGMKPGDMYIAENLLGGGLYAMRLHLDGRYPNDCGIRGIDDDLPALQAFVEATSGWDEPNVKQYISETFHRMLSDSLDKQAAQ